MKWAWTLGLVTLLGCEARVPAQNPLSPSPRQQPVVIDRAVPTATRTPVPGASNPHECEDAPLSEPKPESAPLVGDDALVRLGECTQKLTEPGNLGIAIVIRDGTMGGVFVTESTVHDCRVVGCIKDHLAKERTASIAPMVTAVQRMTLALVPRERIRRVEKVEWPLGKNQSCTDPDDELAEFKSGRLAPEQIQRIIRERYPDFRKCYEEGLASNPKLNGRVTIRFVIGRDGRVSNAYIQGNEVPDCRVAQCVRREMTKSVFPKPENGIVTVVYPIKFEPE